MASLDAPLPRPGSAGAWWLASRPRTLPAAAAPVAVGTSLAFADGVAAAGPATAALLGALLLQVGANLANDLFDFEKGADTEERVGPVRAAQQGLLTVPALRAGTTFAFGAAALLGLYLVWIGGWPVVALGIASILAGLAYTGGPYPLGYHGWGDAAVFVFFGLGAVCGTFWVQAQTLPPHVWGAAVPIGALATAILVVNNLRDRHTDARAGKRTLAVRFGARAARVEYGLLVAIAYATCPVLWVSGALGPLVMLPWASARIALRLVARVAREEGPALNEVLAETARLELVFALLFAAGVLL